MHILLKCGQIIVILVAGYKCDNSFILTPVSWIRQELTHSMEQNSFWAADSHLVIFHAFYGTLIFITIEPFESSLPSVFSRYI